MERCPWCMCNDKMIRYHDEEWGVPLHDDQKQFEFLMMEVMQCGLNWNMMIQKREIFRACFDHFDFDKVAEYRKSLGYYQIVTSELTMDAQEVIDKYHGLTQIEDQFRIMKGDLNTRPLYVRTPEHVTAHLLICMISLILLRIIQKKLKDSGVIQPDPDTYWSGGMSAARIQTALNKWKVDTLPSDLYRFMDVDDPDLKRILDAFRIRIPAKLYRRAELKHIKTEIEVFM